VILIVLKKECYLKRNINVNNMSRCPSCLKELWCGCKSCIEKTRKKVDRKNTLIVWTDDELQSCCGCGHTMHCDQWLDILHEKYNTRERK